MQIPNQTIAGYSMPGIVQNYPMAHNPPNVQSQPIGPNYPFVQNIGFVLSTAPVSPAGVLANTDLSNGPQRQMFGGTAHMHSTPVENQVTPSTSAAFMPQPAQSAQLVQPSQPVAPQKSIDETVEEMKVLLMEEGYNYGGQIRNLRDVARFSEADKRLNRKLTPHLARDFPANDAGQQVLIHNLAFAIRRHATHPQPDSSQQAINCINSKKGITVGLIAGKLVVFQPQRL